MFRLILISLIIVACLALAFHAIKALICVVIFAVLISLLWNAVAPPSGRPKKRWFTEL